MSAIVLGQNLITNKPVKFDVAAFLRSRLLCCASSGGGKSWTLRRLLEQTHRIVQQIVIDLEDEFYTLREKHDYVLGRPDGDFAVTVQSAELLARTLLETKVSAIISLAELPLHERPIFVKKFLNALVNAPRSLWHSVLVVVDEAHLFCLDEETEILTVEGWRRHDQIGPGTVAVAFDIANAEYRYEEVSNVIRKQHRGKMVVLKSDGIDCHVTPEHRVVLRRQQRAKGRVRMYDWTFCQADEVPRHVYVPIGGAPSGPGVEASEDLLRLIGWIATDGHFAGGSTKRYLGISQAHITHKQGRSMVAELDALLGRLDSHSRSERPARASTNGKNSSPSVSYYLGKKLSAKVLAWTGDEIHRIPRALITGCSRAQLEVLMQSLLEGDGTAKGDAWTTFYAGMNEGLADDFQEIALRLGMSVSKKRVPQNGQWTIRISRRRHHYIRRTGSAAYAGTVWCVTLPSGAFVARRHGKVFVTGNCPQKGDVESKKAVIDLLTRGRKRGLIGALATQRLAKLDKDVAAECNVKLIGLCNLPADRGRAVEELGFDKEEERDKRKVFGKIKTGHFFASGPGIDAEDGIVELKVGTVETTHPEPGASDIGVTPPTARIRKALAKLGDLPKEAAAELKTVRELQARVKELEARGPKIVEVEQKVYPAIKTVDKLVLKEGDFAKLNALIARLEKVQARSVLAGEQIQSALLSVRTALGKVNPHVPTVDRPAPSPVPRRAQDPNLRLYRGGPIPSTTTRTLDPKPAAPGSPRGEELDLPVGQAATLDALIQFTAGLDRVKLSVLTGYKRSTRDAYIARLEKAGLVTVGPGTRVTATQAGHDARPNAQPLPVGKDLQVFWLSRLPHGEAAIFKILLAAGGDTVAHVAIDEETGFKRSTRDAYLSRMEAKQIVVRAPGVAAASPNLF